MADMTRRMLMDAAVAKKQTASDRKDDELLAQAEALAFVLAETEETNIDF